MAIGLGDAPTWLAAVGTVGALWVALIQIRTERSRRIARDAADRQERHRSQACLVAAWVGPPEPDPSGRGSGDGPSGRTPIYLLNGSLEPVYTLVASVVFTQGAAPRTTEETLEFFHSREPGTTWSQAPVTTVSILPPGKWMIWIPGTHWAGVMAGRSGAEVAFSDRAGAHWIRRALGKLEELPQPPIEYFQQWQLHGPYALEVPEPAA